MSVECCVIEEVNSLDFYVFNSEETLIRRVVAAETINTEDTGTSRELKKRKHKNLKRTGIKIKCMDNSPGNCQINLIRIELGNCYLKVIKRLEQKH